jgi:Pilus formation protein N terminal region
MGRQMRRAAFLAAIAMIGVVAGVAPVSAADVGVSMDEVTLVTFPKAISAVYVGNTVIADVTMIDTKHVFLLGKMYGATNLLALGADGKVVANDRVTVYGRRAGLVTLNRGASQFNYSCTSNHCEAQPVPGDVTEYFKDTHESQKQHETMANTEANAAPAGSGGSGQ